MQIVGFPMRRLICKKKIYIYVRTLPGSISLNFNGIVVMLLFRQLMVMDESYVINQLKEDVSYVSTQFNVDMQIAR